MEFFSICYTFLPLSKEEYGDHIEQNPDSDPHDDDLDNHQDADDDDQEYQDNHQDADVDDPTWASECRQAGGWGQWSPDRQHRMIQDSHRLISPMFGSSADQGEEDRPWSWVCPHTCYQGPARYIWISLKVINSIDDDSIHCPLGRN